MDNHDHVADEAVDHEREVAAVEEARADVRAGRVVSLKSVKAWVESLGGRHELPPPRAG